MRAKELIGRKVTRTAPAECHYGKDGSYMGDVLIIVNADDDLIVYTYERGILKGETHILSSAWCDDNWKCVEEFLETANENMIKLRAVKEIIQNIKELDNCMYELKQVTK